MFSLDELEHARTQVHRVFAGTPQYRWPLVDRTGCDLWVKHETTRQRAPSRFEGLIHLERLSRDGSAPRGIISATRGNHGQSLAFAGQRFGISVTIVVPHGNSAEKNAAMRALGARLVEHGEDFDAARAEAMRLAASEGLTFAPSFHRDLVLGVATWALELFQAVAGIEVLYVPIGLGSGICGAIRARDLLGLPTEIVGVQSAGADAYAQSIAAGRAIELEKAETRADGLAVRIPDPAALEIIRAGASRIVCVTDDEIAAAMRSYWTDTHNLAEGAGAAPLAALMREREMMAGRRVAVPLCGGNVDLALFKQWVLQ